MPRYTEDDLALAFVDIANGKSLRVAAHNWGVPFSLIYGRIKGKEPYSIASESQQRVLKVQEDHLAQWVLTQEALEVLLTYSQICHGPGSGDSLFTL